MEVTIKGKAYKIRYTLRALFIYENITGKSFNVTTTMEQFLFYYSILLANNPDMKMDLEEFIDACEPDEPGSKKILQAFADLLASADKKSELMPKDEVPEDAKKN